MASMAPVAMLLVLLVLHPSSTLSSRAGPPSSKHSHGGHAKRAPAAASPSSLPPPPPPAQPAAPALVRATCNSTAYYDLCIAELSADPSSSTADVRGLSSIAVSAAAANASGAAQAAAALANATATGTTAGFAEGGVVVQKLLSTCAAKYGDARDALATAKASIAQQDYDMASVHVSAAAEYPQVCKTLFGRQSPGAYPPELAAAEEALRQLCSVALDIIALLSSSNN